MTDGNAQSDHAGHTAKIVSAYLIRNQLASLEVPGLIAQVYNALKALSSLPPSVFENPVPAVPIAKSVTPHYIVCLEDGKQFKSLRGHLTALGTTPDDYRRKWGLPANYPRVAASYSARRSNIAKTIGLGRKRRVASK